MLLETGLRTCLLSRIAVTALVGSGDTARIYPVVLPQGPKLPAITYQRISGVRDRSMRGPSGLTFARIQIDVFATDYAATKDLAEVLRQTLDGLTGSMGDVLVQDVEVENDRDGYEDAVKLFRVGFDVTLWFDEGR